jgi:hypothetical protein
MSDSDNEALYQAIQLIENYSVMLCKVEDTLIEKSGDESKVAAAQLSCNHFNTFHRRVNALLEQKSIFFKNNLKHAIQDEYRK